jgi:Holliday junction resolvase RusA-like endonuclease
MAQQSRARRNPTDSESPVWLVVIPEWTPPSVNVGRGKHWVVEHRAKKQIIETVSLYANIARVPAFVTHEAKRRVTLCVTYSKSHKGRLPDPDNLNKLFRDALKKAYLIVDDSAEWLDMPTPIVERGDKTRTVITFEDLP